MSVYRMLTRAWLIRREWNQAAHMATLENRAWFWLDHDKHEQSVTTA